MYLDPATQELRRTSCANEIVYFDQHECHAPKNTRLLHDGYNFFLETPNQIKAIEPAFQDKLLRNRPQDDILKMIGRKNDTVQYLTPEEMERRGLVLRNENVQVDPSVNKAILDFIEQRSCSPYIEVSVSEEGEPVLRVNGRLNGGGFFGAWAGGWAGYTAVNVGCYTIIGGVGALAGMVGGPVVAYGVTHGLAATFSPLIQTAAITGAMAGGIGGAVATGPV